jgi:hypothetical protein
MEYKEGISGNPSQYLEVGLNGTWYRYGSFPSLCRCSSLLVYPRSDILHRLLCMLPRSVSSHIYANSVALITDQVRVHKSWEGNVHKTMLNADEYPWHQWVGI